MRHAGVPTPGFALPVLLAGNSSLIVGYKARLGAPPLLLFLLAATLKQSIGLMGAMLLIIVLGPGSLDGARQ